MISNRKEQLISGLVALGASVALITGMVAAVELSEAQVMTEELGFKIGKVYKLELINNNNQYMCAVTCKSKETKDIVIAYYNITPIDYVIMNSNQAEAWQYFENKIAPNFNPTKIEKSKTQKTKNSTHKKSTKSHANIKITNDESLHEKESFTPISVKSNFSLPTNNSLEDDFIH